MTLLGVVAAVEAEARGLTRRAIPTGGALYLPEGVFFKLSGSGARASRLAAEDLLKRGVTALLSWGSAGALKPDLPSGTLIIPERILLPDRTSLPVDPAWHREVCRRLDGHVVFYTEPIVQSPVVLREPGDKIVLYERSGAVAADMESGVIAYAARKGGVPFLSIRAISDTASMSIPTSALASVDEFGRLRPFRMIRSLARRPRDLLPLILLGRSFRLAANSLSCVLRYAGPQLAAP